MFNSIFCIDDDPIALMISKKIIAKINFATDVITAKNGEEALQLYNNLLQKNHQNNDSKIDLIFLDLNMPVMSGWQFLEIFTTSKYEYFNKHTKVVIISSSIDPQDVAKAKQFSIVTDFLPKPITVDMLNYLLEKLT